MKIFLILLVAVLSVYAMAQPEAIKKFIGKIRAFFSKKS